MSTSKLPGEYEPLRVHAEFPRAPLNIFEGIVLKRGVDKFCRKFLLTRTQFAGRVRMDTKSLYHAFAGKCPLRTYEYLWLYMQAVHDGRDDVSLYNASLADAD